MEIQGVQQLDRGVRRVDLHVVRHVEEGFRIVEDDPHAGVDELVRRALGARGRDGDHADDDVLVADDLIDSGVKIIFNYSEALLDVPPDVQVHTSNPAVELLYALYFHLT